MTGHPSGEVITDHDVARSNDGTMHVVQDGPVDAPPVLLIHGSAACLGWWDPVVPDLARTHRVIRVDLLGHGTSSSPRHGYGIPAQARRIGIELDRLGVDTVAVVGHSTGCMVATALAEQRPEAVTAVTLIDMSPDMAGAYDESGLARLVLVPVLGPILWSLRTTSTIRGAMDSALTRPVDVPPELVAASKGMTHRAVAGTMRAAEEFLNERSLTERLAPLGIPLSVIFGAEDKRCRASSASAYRVVPGAEITVLPGVGHTPMMEDPQQTAALLIGFLDSLGLSRN